MSRDSKSRNYNMGFAGWLALIFITLKLLDKIDWSWWWVLSPLWIAALAIIPVVIFILVSDL